MASKPQVTLTFAGDSKQLERSFERVGASAKSMSGEVGSASNSVRDSASGFDAASAASDQTYSKMDALESVGRGTTDTMSGLGAIMRGDVLQGSTDLAGGVAALADGFSGALLPAIKGAVTGLMNTSVASVKATVASGAHRVATLAGAAATNVMTVAQKALNLAMRANPIGLVITILFALGAAIVLAYKKSETFRSIVQAAMRGVQTAFGWVLDKGRQLLGWFQALPGKIGGFFRGLGSAISAPFRSAFNSVRSLWNSTVGRVSFSIPSWVPGVGGKGWSFPKMHQGGIVPGAPGTEQLALLQAGERVTPAGRSLPREQALPDEFTVVGTIDLGEGITKVVEMKLRRHDSGIKRAVKSGATRAAVA